MAITSRINDATDQDVSAANVSAEQTMKNTAYDNAYMLQQQSLTQRQNMRTGFAASQASAMKSMADKITL